MQRCLILLGVVLSSWGVRAEDYTPLRCEVVPLADHQVSLRIDGVEKLRWHYGTQYPRPFFFPLRGPSGESLTRMGHPGAENHDHHRSVWFAHYKLNDVNFWNDQTQARIRQKHWYRYRDGDQEALLATRLGWYDESGREVMDQVVMAALRPGEHGEYELEIQTELRPPDGVESVSLNQTNFGLLAVRMRQSISEYFGGGRLSSSEGDTSEKNIFGKPARWMDYSGPVAVGTGPERKVVQEGITFFDHSSNPGYPCSWHVREDGWMGAALTMHQGITIIQGETLTLRYLLYAHSGVCDADQAAQVQAGFLQRPGLRVRGPVAGERHQQYQVERISDSSDR